MLFRCEDKNLEIYRLLIFTRFCLFVAFFNIDQYILIKIEFLYDLKSKYWPVDK